MGRTSKSRNGLVKAKVTSTKPPKNPPHILPLKPTSPISRIHLGETTDQISHHQTADFESTHFPAVGSSSTPNALDERETPEILRYRQERGVTSGSLCEFYPTNPFSLEPSSHPPGEALAQSPAPPAGQKPRVAKGWKQAISRSDHACSGLGRLDPRLHLSHVRRRVQGAVTVSLPFPACNTFFFPFPCQRR